MIYFFKFIKRVGGGGGGERDKIKGTPSIICILFCNEFKKINKAETRMLDFIYEGGLVNISLYFI